MSLGACAKVAIGWAIVSATGIYAFILSKDSIEKQRSDAMKVRERIRKSNYGEYETIENRFNH